MFDSPLFSSEFQATSNGKPLRLKTDEITLNSDFMIQKLSIIQKPDLDSNNLLRVMFQVEQTQPVSTTEIPEQGVKSVQS